MITRALTYGYDTVCVECVKSFKDYGNAHRKGGAHIVINKHTERKVVYRALYGDKR